MTDLWDRALDDDNKLPLPPVIPLVFYHGRRRWRFPTEFDALLGGPEALAPFMPRFRYALIDLSQYADDEIRGGVLLRVALLAMRHIYDRDLPQHMPRIARLLLAVIGTRSGLRALEALMSYFATASDLVGAKEVREALKGLPIEGEKLMGTLAEKWIRGPAPPRRRPRGAGLPPRRPHRAPDPRDRKRPASAGLAGDGSGGPAAGYPRRGRLPRRGRSVRGRGRAAPKMRRRQKASVADQ